MQCQNIIVSYRLDVSSNGQPSLAYKPIAVTYPTLWEKVNNSDSVNTHMQRHFISDPEYPSVLSETVCMLTSSDKFSSFNSNCSNCSRAETKEIFYRHTYR